MKKLLSLLAIISMVMLMSVPVIAQPDFLVDPDDEGHPAVPTVSIGKISENSIHGMHTAYSKIQGKKAAHIFEIRFNPH